MIRVRELMHNVFQYMQMMQIWICMHLCCRIDSETVLSLACQRPYGETFHPVYLCLRVWQKNSTYPVPCNTFLNASARNLLDLSLSRLLFYLPLCDGHSKLLLVHPQSSSKHSSDSSAPLAVVNSSNPGGRRYQREPFTHHTAYKETTKRWEATEEAGSQKPNH